MAKKKKKKNSKWLDLSAFNDGYDVGDVTRTIVKSGKKSANTAKKAVQKKTNEVAEDTFNFLSSRLDDNTKTVARNIVSGTTGLSLLNELFDDKIGNAFSSPFSVNEEERKEKEEKQEERTYFKEGAFKDGYQFGDIGKTMYGTLSDIGENIGSGLGRIGEGVIDTVAYGVGATAKGLGKEKFADKTKEFIARDLVDEYKIGEKYNKSFFGAGLPGLGNSILNKGNTESASVLGDKSDSIVESGGQLLGTMGLQYAGVPWYVTTGVTGFGSGTQEAFQNDATYGEAGIYGGITAGSEILFEKLGGIKFGGKALDTGLKKELSRAISNKTAKALTKFGIDVTAEGTEEVLTEITQNVGKKLTYEDEKTWAELLTSEEAMDQYLEAFVGGAVMGGAFNAGKVVQTHKTGRDYDTGLTDNEQTVVNAEVEARAAEKIKKAAVDAEVSNIIAEQEKTFGTLSETEKKNIRNQVQEKLDNGELDYTTTTLNKKERAEIEKQVEEDLRKGYIGIDTIESTLSGEKTIRLKELEQQLKETTDKAQKSAIEAEINELKGAKAEELKNLLSKDILLQESYRQEALKHQEFTREITDKDTDITKELLESAKNVGMGNNRKMHDLFEYTNKIANDTKTKYGFVNNEQLKQLGYDFKGKTINGLVRANADGTSKVLINVDSNKSLNTIIGHETTHLLEGTAEHDALKAIVKEYATAKGDYDAKLKELSGIYDDIDTDIENEVTADLIGDYLFTDEQFINNLSTKEPNVFQKIYDYIKRVYKMATAGSSEARQLEEIKRKFDKAYKQISKATTQVTGDNFLTEADSNSLENVKLSTSRRITTDADVAKYLDTAAKNKTKRKTIKAWEDGERVILRSAEETKSFIDDAIEDADVVKQAAYGQVNERLSKSVAEANEALNISDYYLELNPSDLRHAYEHSKESNQYPDNIPLTKEDMERIPEYIDNFTDILDTVNKGKKKSFVTGTRVNGYTVIVEMVSDGRKAVRPKTMFKMNTESYLKRYGEVIKKKKANIDAQVQRLETGSNRTPSYSTSSTDNIPINENIVNGKQARELTKEQQEYFKDSKVRDENGNLKVMYHGTSSGGHTVFDPYGKSKYGLFGAGSYFTDNKSVAESYTEKGKGSNKQVYETYLNITNPIDMDAQASREAWIKALPDANFPETGTNEDFYRAMEEYFEDQEYAKWEASEAAMDIIEDMGYDGITHVGGGRFNKADETRHQVYIAFHPEQIKNIDNSKPTTDADIRYSLTDSNGRELTKAQQEYFKDSKVRDDSGNLLAMYHGTPNAEFTVFRDGTYFTQNKEYADVYQNQGASSLGYKKTANNPDTYKVYLNIKKPFDTREPEARRIFEEEYYRQWGMGTPLMESGLPDWMDGEDLKEFIEENGYDYDGLILDEGGVGGYGDEVKSRGLSYVVFGPEQVKNVSNENPTSDPDIRFSLSKPVEETKDLVAVHNMRSSELMKTLDLGGLPMPSIAIIKAQSGHSEYGDVSLLFNKETIDPEFMRANKVYGGDAWTPTYPTIEYKPNKKVADKISDMYYELARKYGYDELRPLYNYANDLEETLNRHKGEAGIIESLSDDTSMMQVYLLASGKGKVEDVEKEVVTELSEAEIEMNEHFIKALGEDIVRSIKTPSGTKPITHRKDWLADHKAEAENAYTSLLRDVYKFTDEEIENVLISTKPLDYVKMIRDANNYLEKGSRTVKTEIDHEATREKIKETASDGYSEWLKDLFSGVEEKSGIRNNAEMFTRSGNRRSWEALHWENNLENVVKVMKEEENGVGFFGGSGIWGVSAKEYGSIEEIRADSSRLERMSEEEYSEIKESLGQRFQEISISIMSKTERNQFMAIDNAMEAIVDAVRSSKTKSGILNVLKQYPQLTVTETTADDIVSLVQDIAAMPTEYFESKPRRAVGLDEIAAVIIPDNADSALLSRLEEGGYNVVTYEAGNEVDRAAKLNAQNNVKFSLSNKDQDISPIGRYNVYGSDVLMPAKETSAIEEIAPVKETAETVEKTAKDTVNMGNPLTDEDIPYVEQQRTEAFNNITDDMAPVEQEPIMPPYEEEVPVEPKSPFEDKDMKEVGKRDVKSYMYENPEVKPFFQSEAAVMLTDLNNSIRGEKGFNDELYYITGGEQGFWGTKRQTTEDIAYLLDEYKYSYKDIEKGLKAIIEDNGKENNAISKRIEFFLDERLREGYESYDGLEIPPNEEYINFLKEKQIVEYDDVHYEEWLRHVAEGEVPALEADIASLEAFEKAEEESVNDKLNELIKEWENYAKFPYNYSELEGLSPEEQIAQIEKDLELFREIINDSMQLNETDSNREQLIEQAIKENFAPIANNTENPITEEVATQEETQTDAQEENLVTKTRKELRKELLVDKTDFFKVAMDNAKNKAMALLNNTDTIRVQELVFGRSAGKKINEVIFQKAIDNEAKSIRWQNKQRADIKALGIKARSKESAAVQKYGEKQYVNEFGDIMPYGEAELKAEFKNEKDRIKIRKAATVIRQKYDEYIDTANSVITQLGFAPIPRRDDYMRHFQELNDVFSRYGLPFNAQSMQEHTLPTDINGLTEFWSPQKNYFANMQPRKGIRTEYDAVTGVDGYISGIANLIFHTKDIQRGRAFEEMIRNRFGQETADETLNSVPEEERAALLEKIQNNHLSNYAAWVHEWTNNIAGKKNKIDRSIESMFGRRAFSFLDTARKQVGANMIGFNVSSSLTNLISPVQAMAKTNKIAVLKGTVDTFKNIVKNDGFVDKNLFLTSRFGTDMLSKTAWQKTQDAAYLFMKGIDYFASNMIVRSKYHELKSKGMSDDQAHAEAGQFAARIMGDRTKGANAQLYNSKLVGMVTQFQLEVNNQLYSMFYDTLHESKEKANGNAAKAAAGMTLTLGQLFAFTHVFGKAFEGLAGYNPTFDVIGIIQTLLGIGDDEEDKKPLPERAEAAVMQLLKSLPYTSTFTGGRIPVGQAFPIEQLVTGKDDYNNDKSRIETIKETLPYYLLPGGYGQIKKTTQGLKMFDKDLPVAGSYTDSGNLRFPVEDTLGNRVKSAVFGQWSHKEAQDYIDNERAPLKEKQIQEYKDLDIPIADYWKYREGLKGKDSLEEKFDYIAGLDLPVSKKNIMINNIVDRKEDVDIQRYSDFGSYEEFDFATKNPKKYALAKAIGGYESYEKYSDDLWDIRADKDSSGKSISGTRKAKVINYINELPIGYEERLILFKKEYPSDDLHNQEIIDYLNNRNDISYDEMVYILEELDFTVTDDGTIYW